MIDLIIEREKAKKGDGLAAYKVARSLINAENGAQKNYDEAYKMYLYGSSLKNNALCLFGLGICYENGLGIDKDIVKAKNYYTIALPGIKNQAKLGEEYSQYCLGYYYCRGETIPQNYELGAYWYNKAAKQNNPGALRNLAHCYFNGHGVPQDTKKAAVLYEKAKEIQSKKEEGAEK